MLSAAFIVGSIVFATSVPGSASATVGIEPADVQLESDPSPRGEPVPNSALPQTATPTPAPSPEPEPPSDSVPSPAEAADTLGATATGTASISGRVTLDDGRPLANGVVAATLKGAEAPASQTATREDGTYRLEGLPAGAYTLHFWPNPHDPAYEGFLGEYWNNAHQESDRAYFAVASGQTVTGRNAQLSKGATISGRVTLEDGARRAAPRFPRAPRDWDSTSRLPRTATTVSSASPRAVIN
ncbi:hypothetical protein GCM10009747_27890 [Agromyces humatus]|uniref:Alpha-amylase n=2 Tax=Agromyces humatus TaxID=279573 RepID=A0ABP4X0A3_9MICO